MWVKLDDKLHSHPKVGGVLQQALGLHLLALSYCGDQLTEGSVPGWWVRQRGEDPEIQVAALVAAGLWEADGEDWLIHDFPAYNPSRAEVEAARAELSVKRADAGRKGAAARWQNGKRPGKRGAPAVAKA